MFKVFSKALKVKDIRRKFLYILLVLVIIRLGSFINLPGIDAEMLKYAMSANNANFINMLVGGDVGSIFELGIGPYITASIIMQLLTVAIPSLERLKKEGQEGTKKINQYTRIFAVVLSIIQGFGNVYFRYRDLFIYQHILVYLMATVSVVTGTIFIMWLAELLTEKGLGNGSSFVIFANILSGLPAAVITLYGIGMQAEGIYGWLTVVIVLVIFAALMVFVVLIQEGERRIPVQYSKKMSGRTMQAGQASFIPIKVNIAGVMSIIFALSLISFPSVIIGFLGNNAAGWLITLGDVLQINQPIGAVLYIILIFFFTFFYTSFAINPIEMSENMKKNSGIIPGIRQGKPTSDYIQSTVQKLSWVGASAYSLIAIVPILFQVITGYAVGFGGTTLLIVTGVALEIVKQLQSQMLMKEYKGFLN